MLKMVEYRYTRGDVAGAAGVSVDVVRMEERKGTFETLEGLCRWVVVKMLSGRERDERS